MRLSSQSLLNQNQIQLKSPQVAAFEKVGLVPASLNTGQINPSINICNFSVEEINIPINLSYSNTGLKIGENATWVGLGWNLSVGGVISQNVKGIPDDGPVGLLYPAPNNELFRFLNSQMTEFERDQYIQNVTNLLADSERDVFTFNYLGRSGSFFFDETGVIRQFQRSDLQFFYTIENNQLSSFTIIDENGYSYLFNIKELSSFSQGDIQSSTPIILNGYSWYLSSMTTPAGITVSFNYENDVTFNDVSDTYVLSYGAIGASTGCGIDLSLSNIQSSQVFVTAAQKKIKEIVSHYGKVIFNTLPIREDLKDASGQKSSVLSEVILLDASNNIIRKSIFTYSHFLDHTYQPSNRLKLQSVALCGVNCDNPQVYQFTYFNEANPFPPLQSQSKDFDHWGYYNGAGNYMTIPAFNAADISGIGGNYFGANKNSNSNYSRYGLIKTITYPTGGTSIFEYEGNIVDITGYLPCPIFIKTSNPSAYEVGGNRIKSITYNDPISGSQTKQHFEYSSEIGLKYIPNYLSTKEYMRQVSSFGYESCGNTYFISDRPQNSMPGFNIEYTSVIEKSETLGQNGFKKVFYSKSDDIGSNYQPFTTVINTGWRAGQQLKTEYYMSNNSSQQNLVEKHTNEYLTSYYLPMSLGLTSLKIAKRITGNPPVINGINFYETGIYTFFTEQTRLNQSKIENYTPTDLISKSIIYSYENQQHCNKTREVTVSSKGEDIETRYYYVKDFDNTAALSIQDLKNRNINALLRVDRFSNSLLISSSVNVVNNIGLPTSRHQSMLERPTANTAAGTTSLFRSGVDYINREVLSYNSDNRIASIDRQGYHTSYIWGYKKSYPVAKIMNAPYSIAQAYINQSILNNASGGSDDVYIRDHLSNLRNIPGALVTTYTYKPLLGITSETNQNGKTTYYEYDGANRLRLIRDYQSNIIKKLCYNYYGQPENCITNCSDSNPNWQNTGDPLRCQVVNGQNTGYQEQQQQDLNPCSPTSGQIRWISAGFNQTACPAYGGNIMLMYNNPTGISGFTATYIAMDNPNSSYSFPVPVGSGVLGYVPSGVYELIISKPGNEVAFFFNCVCKATVGKQAHFYKVYVTSTDCNAVNIENFY